ncbi:MAG: hypothetical protein WBB28_15000 [Crinalium sp.]
MFASLQRIAIMSGAGSQSVVYCWITLFCHSLRSLTIYKFSNCCIESYTTDIAIATKRHLQKLKVLAWNPCIDITYNVYTYFPLIIRLHNV